MKLASSEIDFPVAMPEVTHHAEVRIAARRLHYSAISAALTFGRVLYIRGARVYVMGRKEVQEAGDQAAFLERHIGVHVVCGDGGKIITAYRSRNLRSLRPHKREPDRLWRALRPQSVYQIAKEGQWPLLR